MEKVFHERNIRMIGGGTDNHLILSDIYGSIGIIGKEAQTTLDEVGITLNMNSITYDERKPLDPSGIRFGTPPMTIRGFKENHAQKVAHLMLDALENKDNEIKKSEIREEIRQLCVAHPIPEKFV